MKRVLYTASGVLTGILAFLGFVAFIRSAITLGIEDYFDEVEDDVEDVSDYLDFLTTYEEDGEEDEDDR